MRELASETNAAYLRQKASWEQIEQVEVVDRPLQYIKGQPPRQKGVDVAMALDIVTLGSRGEYDCAAVVSTDTDLLPAIEYIKELGSPSIEVACWWSKRLHKRLRLREGWIWCHRLSSEDYDSVCRLQGLQHFSPQEEVSTTIQFACGAHKSHPPERGWLLCYYVLITQQLAAAKTTAFELGAPGRTRSCDPLLCKKVADL